MTALIRPCTTISEALKSQEHNNISSLTDIQDFEMIKIARVSEKDDEVGFLLLFKKIEAPELWLNMSFKEGKPFHELTSADEIQFDKQPKNPDTIKDLSDLVAIILNYAKNYRNN